MRSRTIVPFFFGAFFLLTLLVGLSRGRAFADDGATMPVPSSPGLPTVTGRAEGASTQRWSLAPTYSFYMLPGGGLSRYLDQGMGVGGELSYRLGDLPPAGQPESLLSHFRILGDVSYFQMTPGPNLAPPSTGGLFNFSSPTTIPPIPGSASVTGFILRVGVAYDIFGMIPDSLAIHRILVPYVRLDAGGADFAVSNVPKISGHPYGEVFDVGAGLSLSIPGYPLGVFGEADPTLFDFSNNVMTILPLVAGIMVRF
ncbi:MAG: hypothetical protein ACP5OP_02780 [Leptospirillia bacterium]